MQEKIFFLNFLVELMCIWLIKILKFCFFKLIFPKENYLKFPDIFFYSAMPAMHIRQTSDDGLPIPPYMPMQQPMSKRSTSLEKRIKKKKEKEGCKQQ